MQFQDILKEIKQSQFRSIYLLSGEEPYFIDKIAQALEQKVLKEEEKSFNQSILYGSETTMQSVLAEARRYPMMSERVLVVVREAQHLKNWELLESYAENPQPSTVLVLAHKHKKVDKRRKAIKLIKDRHLLFEAKRVYDNQMPDWIQRSLKNRRLEVTPKACQILAESLGTDLARVENELDKLALIAEPGQTVDDQLVEANIGISKDFNNFELQRAFVERDFKKIMRIQRYYAANPKDHPLVLTLAVLFNFASKLMVAHQASDKSPRGLAATLKVNPYFVKDYTQALRHYDLKKCARMIGYLREADLRSKGVNNAQTPEHELLKELLFKMYHV